VKRMQALYRKAGKRSEKSRLLGHVSETLDCGRRQAKRLMRGKEPPVERPFRLREPEYPERLIRILEQVWEAAQYPWSVRLKAILLGWRQWILRHWTLSAKEQRQLLSISPATIDRRLGPYKKRLGRKIYGQTKQGRWLRQTIPIQTESWNVPEPGWLESDTVSHSGSNASGAFAATLNQVDLFSGWVEMRAILGKKAADIVAAADEMRQEMPFLLKGMDTDCGEEFINYELDRWCHDKEVQRFRSRPYKKDDQAHIEQKNGTHVRRLIGWNRYDTQQAVDAMNDLYRNEWRLLANLFLPSVKLTNKVRIGSRIKRVYDDAKTPLDRLWDSGQGDREKLRLLRNLRGRLDPFELSAAVDRKLKTIWNLASHGRIKPAPTDYVPVRGRWNDLMRTDNDPRDLFQPHSNSDLGRISRMAWRDSFFGTN
jgi:hypothetical protein